MTEMDSGMTECHMGKADWSTLMGVCILGHLSREFQVAKVDLSVHKAGTMRES